jgi:8-oxo-dGTP diphosphatase
MNTIDVFADGLKKSDVSFLTPRIACRAVVIVEGKVLCVYQEKLDIYTLPGGGLEQHESLEQCVIRELMEETGYQGIHPQASVVVKEYFSDSIWESHFFTVSLVGKSPLALNLTQEERDNGLEVRWIDVFDFLSILESYPSKNPYGSNIHNREFLGFIHSV